jgi:quinol-cytochrome oxidoreductase complex cytochrome b subunit
MENNMVDQHQDEEKTIPFFPDHIGNEAKQALLILGLLFGIGVVGLFLPIGLEAPADPMNTPEHVQPEWYFLFLYELLKYVPKAVGIAIPLYGLALLTIWPFLDRREDGVVQRNRRIWIALGVMLVVVVLTLIALPALSGLLVN